MHNFFRRHVYAAMSRPLTFEPADPKPLTGALHRAPRREGLVSRPAATFITFLISALAHELVMGCITKKLRGYGFFAMMMQMPIVMVQRSRWIRGRTLLNVSLFCSPLPSL